jgi:hypothetical protein
MHQQVWIEWIKWLKEKHLTEKKVCPHPIYHFLFFLVMLTHTPKMIFNRNNLKRICHYSQLRSWCHCLMLKHHFLGSYSWNIILNLIFHLSKFLSMKYCLGLYKRPMKSMFPQSFSLVILVPCLLISEFPKQEWRHCPHCTFCEWVLEALLCNSWFSWDIKNFWECNGFASKWSTCKTWA